MQNFDKLFKEKLDEISPTYHPSVWTRISKKIPVAPFWAFAASTLPWYIAGLTTVGLFAMGYQTHILREETRYLHQTLDSTLILTAKNQRILLSQQNKTDTIYLTSAFVSNTNQPDPGLYKLAFLEGYKAALAQLSAQNSPESTFNRTAKESGNHVRSDGNQVSILNPGSALSNKGDLFGPGLDKPDQPLEKNLLPTLNGQVQNEKPKTDSIKSITAQNAILDSLIKELRQNANKKSEGNRFRLPNLKPRLGIEFSGNHLSSIGIGPGMEFQLFQNLGFNLGLLAHAGRSQSFGSAAEFNSKTGLDFKTLYSEKIGPDPGKIEEIEVKVSSIEIPLRVKYYVPIKNNFSLLTFVGTHFNISSQENVKCEKYIGTEEEHFSFTKKTQTTLFHNYIFGLGMEYKGEKVIWQLAPWYTYNFRKSSDFEDKNTFGLSLMMWLPLKR